MAGKKTRIHSQTLKKPMVVPSPVKPFITERSVYYVGSESQDSILLTGGLGDIITLESFFPDELKKRLKIIYYATIKNNTARRLMSALPFPNLKSHITVWNDFSNFWCFITKQQLIVRLNEIGKTVIPDLIKSQDWCIADKFTQIRLGKYHYQGSSFLKYNLCNIAKFNLPNNSVVICPYSSDKRGSGRDFNKEDWKVTSDYLQKWNMTGVIINCGQDTYFPDNFVNLNNQTSILEAIEIIKSSKGYIGVDSCLSVLATQLFDDNRIIIKSINPHCKSWRDVYFMPKKNFDFMRNQI
jgi:hypothetical protein